MNAPSLQQRELGDLVSTRWLAQNLEAPWLRVVDVRDGSPVARRSERKSGTVLRASEEYDPPRFVELGPNGGWLRAGEWPRTREASEAYRRDHIPGAIALDVGRRFFDDTGAVVWAPEVAMAMSDLGIGDEHTVVLVDEQQPSAALVAAWILRRAGHERTAILGGGFPRWSNEGRPTTQAVVRHPFASFTAKVR